MLYTTPKPADFELSSYEYDLPPQLIAQHPLSQRDNSRLMVVGLQSEEIRHHVFSELAQILPARALLVANNSKVFPARLAMERPSGGKMEMLLLTPLGLIDGAGRDDGIMEAQAEALLRPAGKAREGMEINSPHLSAKILRIGEYGRCRVMLRWRGSLAKILDENGAMPLPPYIKSAPAPQEIERYQTTYATAPGSVAAPTAGLHFTPELREELSRQGHQWEEVTLHVGYGTFSPVRVGDIRQHEMHGEYVEISENTVNAIANAKMEGRPVIAVGTTATRALEGVAAKFGQLRPYAGMINTFIYPGVSLQIIDGLLTNFHLPGSTLLMLVSALAGRRKILAAYAEAVQQKYRFFSWGDAMLLY